MTTNAGAQEMAAAAIGFGDVVERASKGQKALERLFSPEFRNRLDAVVHVRAARCPRPSSASSTSS